MSQQQRSFPGSQTASRTALAGLVAIVMLSLAGSAHATALLGELIYVEVGGAGDTVPDQFALTNLSDPGVTLTHVHVDLSGAGVPAGSVHLDSDAAGAQPGIHHPLAATSGAGATGFGSFGDQAAIDGGPILDLPFAGFDPGETFNFVGDLDDGDAIVSALDLIGATATVTFDVPGEGTFEVGISSVALVIPGNPFAARVTFALQTAVPAPATALLLVAGLVLVPRRRRPG